MTSWPEEKENFEKKFLPRLGTIIGSNYEKEFDVYSEKLRGRMEDGNREYGNASFHRSLLEILGESKEEAVDVPGWMFIFWTIDGRSDRALSVCVLAFMLWVSLCELQQSIEREIEYKVR